MTDQNMKPSTEANEASKWVEEKNRRISANVHKRFKKERRFRFFGIVSLSVAFVFLATLLFSIISKGYGAFITTEMQLEVVFDAERLELSEGFTEDELKEYLSKISDEALYAYNVYQIEGEGRNLFSSIKGDEETIMGLPIKKIKEYLEIHGG